MTQSAVSQQVAQLEQRLGKRLIERGGRNIRLTPHGELLATACQRGFGVLDAALLRVARGGDENSLRFKLPPTFALRWLMPRLPEFQVLYPQLGLHVSTSVQPVDFEAEDVDISMQRAQDELPPDLHAVAVMEERCLLVCSPKLWGQRRADVNELEGMTFLYSANRPDDWAIWLRHMGRPQLQPRNQLEFEFSLLLYQGAADGLGVAIAQPEFIWEELASGKLIAPFQGSVSTGKRYFLMCPAERKHTPAVARFFAWIQGKMGEAVTDRAPGSG